MMDQTSIGPVAASAILTLLPISGSTMAYVRQYEGVLMAGSTRVCGCGRVGDVTAGGLHEVAAGMTTTWHWRVWERPSSGQ